MSTEDIFEPRWEPAKSLYRAFQDEATRRPQRTVEQWTTAELHRVHDEATRLAPKHGMPAPSLDEVRRAEISARGHIDYGAKWVYRTIEIMRANAELGVQNDCLDPAGRTA